MGSFRINLWAINCFSTTNSFRFYLERTKQLSLFEEKNERQNLKKQF